MKKKSHPPILDLIAQTIYDKKGSNILILDVSNISSLTDFFIIAEGNVDRHVKSIADELMHTLQPEIGHPSRKEGCSGSDWIVLDYTNFLIHLFTPELRERYSLEKVWNQGVIVDVLIHTHLQ
ncbi:MAG: ribosome silencing factor [Parachlamydiales bacterium]|jgi:ribosome-associated protein